MKREALVGVFAGVLLAFGLLVGFVPVHGEYGVSCGSPFAPEADASADRCEPKLNSNRPVAILLTAVGAAGLFAALVSISVAGRQEPSTADAAIDE